MTFKRWDSIRSKIVIDNKIIEQANSFNYLGNLISYETLVQRSPTLCLYVCDQETPKREAKDPSRTISACERMISYENQMNTDNKLNNYLKITGIINNVFRPKKTLKKTRIKLYNTLAIPALL
jgi:hypothetical protein